MQGVTVLGRKVTGRSGFQVGVQKRSGEGGGGG